MPAGLLPIRQAVLQDMSHVSATTGDVTFGDGEIHMGANARVTIAGNFTGNLWVHSVTKDVTGTYRARFLSPTYQPEGTRQADGMQTWKFPAAAAQGSLDFLTGTNSACTLIGLQVVDMGSVLAKPAKVVLALGQSLMECSSVSLGINRSFDHWPGARCLYLPGATYAGRGTTRAEPHAMHVPLQFNAIGNGVSPAAAFAQELLPFVPESHSLVIAAGAWSQTSLVGADGDWNPAATSADRAAYQNAIDLVTTGLSNLPAGSEVIGALWAQGQGDLSATFDLDYPPAFAAMRAQMEVDLGTGSIPWLILGPPPDAVATYQNLFREALQNMDQDSGHALAQTGVHTITHPTGYIEDGTHVSAWGSRVMGRLAARKFIAEAYL
jgi:hypothetical protein